MKFPIVGCEALQIARHWNARQLCVVWRVNPRWRILEIGEKTPWVLQLVRQGRHVVLLGMALISSTLMKPETSTKDRKSRLRCFMGLFFVKTTSSYVKRAMFYNSSDL